MEFLLSTSVVEKLSGPLCDAVLGRPARASSSPRSTAEACSSSRSTGGASGTGITRCSAICSGASSTSASRARPRPPAGRRRLVRGRGRNGRRDCGGRAAVARTGWPSSSSRSPRGPWKRRPRLRRALARAGERATSPEVAAVAARCTPQGWRRGDGELPAAAAFTAAELRLLPCSPRTSRSARSAIGSTCRATRSRPRRSRPTGSSASPAAARRSRPRPRSDCI